MARERHHISGACNRFGRGRRHDADAPGVRVGFASYGNGTAWHKVEIETQKRMHRKRKMVDWAGQPRERAAMHADACSAAAGQRKVVQHNWTASARKQLCVLRFLDPYFLSHPSSLQFFRLHSSKPASTTGQLRHVRVATCVHCTPATCEQLGATKIATTSMDGMKDNCAEMRTTWVYKTYHRNSNRGFGLPVVG